MDACYILVPHPHHTTLGQSGPLWPRRFDSVFPRAKLEEYTVCPEGRGIEAACEGTLWGPRETDFLGLLEKKSSLPISPVQPRVGCPRRKKAPHPWKHSNWAKKILCQRLSEQLPHQVGF